MKSLGEVLALSIRYLKEKGSSKPRYYAESIFAHVLSKDRMGLYTQFDCPLEEKELEVIRGYLKRITTEEPLEYILQQVDFYGCRLKVDSRVLIPRPETELLLDEAIKILSGFEKKGKVAWDVCTGSGCIGLGLKKRFPELDVVLSDLSSEALNVAQTNAERLSLDVVLRNGNLLEPFFGEKADYIFCNPPYVSKNEWQVLDASVKDFEPFSALVGGETGLEFYQRLSRDLPTVLNPEGRVFLEIGSSQGEAVVQIFSDPCWLKKEVIKDLAGHDRFFFLEIE